MDPLALPSERLRPNKRIAIHAVFGPRSITMSGGGRLSACANICDRTVSATVPKSSHSKTELKPTNSIRSPHDRQSLNTRFDDNSAILEPRQRQGRSALLWMQKELYSEEVRMEKGISYQCSNPLFFWI
jgi:hypothetical protein